MAKKSSTPQSSPKYKLEFMFEWGNAVCVWSANEDAKEKFKSDPIGTWDLPISQPLKDSLDELTDAYQTAFDYENANGKLLWNKSQITEFKAKAKKAYTLLCEELGPEYGVDLNLKGFEQSADKSKTKSKIKIYQQDGELKVSGSINLGYIGNFTSAKIEITDTLEDIRDWDIVDDHLDEDCTDDEIIAFLNKYFNQFVEKIERNIENINGTFLLYAFTDMNDAEINFMIIDELFIEENLRYGNEEDIAEIYNPVRDGLNTLAPYLESPNDGTVPKGHIENLLKSFFPMFNFDNFIANIEPECLTLDDGEISFQCSDNFDNEILCGAYGVIDEELSITDWHNF